MRRKSFLTGVLVVSVGFAIAVAAAKSPKKRPGGAVSMHGTFRDDASDGIKSDSRLGGQYNDSEDGLRVGIQSNGLFRLSINEGRKNAGKSDRHLTLDISNCLEGGVPDGCVDFTDLLVPESLEVDDFVALRLFDTPDENGVTQNLSTLGNPGESAALNAALLFSTFDDNKNREDNWALDFRTHDDPDSLCFDSGGPLLATRTGADTWEIEAVVGTDPNTTDQACLTSGHRGFGPQKFRGTYEARFKLTVVSNP